MKSPVNEEVNNDLNMTKNKSSRRNFKFLVPTPPDASPNLKRASSRYITVEPIMWLIMAGFGVVIQVFPQFMRFRIALENNVTLPNGGINDSSCVDRNTSNPYYVLLQEVQAEVAYWQMIQELCHRLPAIFVSPILGAWSDIVGRKIVLALTTFGFVIYGLAFLLAFHLMLPIWVLPLGFGLTGMTFQNVSLSLKTM